MCNFVIFVLTLRVLQSRINRGKSRDDMLEIPDAILTRYAAEAATPPVSQVPGKVFMYNPRHEGQMNTEARHR